MNYTKTIYTLASVLLLVGCSDSQNETKNTTVSKEPLKIIEAPAIKAPKVQAPKVQTPLEVSIPTENFSMEKIYNSMCIICHSADGSGNTEKLTPSMTHLSEQEMVSELKEVEADEGHIIMEHNRGEILKMGMEYKAKDMAKYMFDRFNK